MPEKKQSKKIHSKKIHKELIRQIITLFISSFSLIAALAWNNVVQYLVNEYLKKYVSVGSGVLSLFIYALFITAILVFITLQLTKILDKIQGEHE